MLKTLLQSLGSFYYYPNNGNLGDLLIAEATRQYFQTLGLKWKDFDTASPPQEESITIVYAGGGRFTPHWSGLENIVNVLTAPNVKRAVILPHSFTGIDSVIQAMDERHTLVCREQRSYEYVKSLQTKSSVLLADDMALRLNLSNLQPITPTTPSAQTLKEEEQQRKLLKSGWKERLMQGVKDSTVMHQGKRIAFLLRKDCEKQSALNSPYSYDLSSTWDTSGRSTQHNAAFIRTFAESLRYPDCIVTDRLHIGIMGFLLGKEVYLLDNDYGKLSGVYQQSLKDAPHIHLLKEDTLTPELQRAWEALNAPSPSKQAVVQEPEYQLLQIINKLQKKHRKVTLFSKITVGKKRTYYIDKRHKIQKAIHANRKELEKWKNASATSDQSFYAPSPRLKRYIELYVPVTTCTLHCHYCYIYHQGLFKNKLPEFKYPPEVVKKALSTKRLGGTCLINICGGGETLLPPQLPDYLLALLEEGHFLSIVTNGTVSRAFDRILTFPPEYLKRIFFKFSYHYLELKEKNLFDLFFNNIRRMRDAGCSFVLELTPNDESIPYIDEIKQRAVDELGAVNHLTIARDDVSPLADKPILTKLPHDEYYKVWGVFNSDMMTFKRTIFGQKRKEFCYAGAWSFYLNLGTGIKTQCYCSFKSENIFDNPDKPIDFTPIGRLCSQPLCYNGHAFLTLGCIPELDTITYAQLRNRVCQDGSEWLQPGLKAFFSCKLKDHNRQYSALEKWIHQLRYKHLKTLKRKLRSLKKGKKT